MTEWFVATNLKIMSATAVVIALCAAVTVIIRLIFGYGEYDEL